MSCDTIRFSDDAPVMYDPVGDTLPAEALAKARIRRHLAAFMACTPLCLAAIFFVVRFRAGPFPDGRLTQLGVMACAIFGCTLVMCLWMSFAPPRVVLGIHVRKIDSRRGTRRALRLLSRTSVAVVGVVAILFSAAVAALVPIHRAAEGAPPGANRQR